MVRVAGEVEIVECFGALDHIYLDGDLLILHGWAAPFDAVEFDGFQVELLGGPSLQVQSAVRLPSPDVQQVHPGLYGADACRFQLTLLPSDEQRARLADSVVAVTPLAGSAVGQMMVRMPADTLPLPDQELIDTIGAGSAAEFLAASAAFLTYGTQRAGVRPRDHVLDVGCGCGRMAYGLIHYLRPEGRYEGFDIDDRLIGWATRTIGRQYPNFRFRRVDLYNKMYNPSGVLRPSDFEFPYEARAFDYALLTSVFTHIFLHEIEHYLEELYRVLRPGGRCLFTCFLINAESEDLIRTGRSAMKLEHRIGGGYAASREVPEASIGFEEPTLLRCAAERGFEVSAVYPGSWCGRKRYTSFQDMVILRKPDELPPRWR